MDNIITTPERVSTYLENRTGDRLPFSCTLATLGATTQIPEIIHFATKSLKSGAGVKLVITKDFKLSEPKPDFTLVVEIKDNTDLQYAKEVPESCNLNGIYHPDTAVIKVEDSVDSILEGITKLFEYSQTDQAVVVDLSLLRPRDTTNDKGLVASGAVIFSLLFEACAFHIKRQTMHSLLRLFGMLNHVILRGGYKKGIITSSIEDTSPYLLDYLNVPLVSLPGSHKKGVILHHKPTGQLRDLINSKVNSESMFLEKHQPGKGYANVCQGIFLKDRGTCLIYRINLGQVSDFSQIVPAFTEATKLAIYAHWEWRLHHSEKAKLWASIESDNQVAVDVMGMANLLSNFGITYDSFIDALEGNTTSTEASNLVAVLQEAYEQSCYAADSYAEYKGLPLFSKLHTVEPAQSHSYRSVDLKGKTIARGIWTPFSRFVNRMSHAANEQVKTYDFGQVETRLTPDQHFRLCQGYYSLMAKYGRPHAFSYDTLIDFNAEEFDKWYNSPLPTLYYNLSKDYHTDFSRKVIKPVKLCSSCED